MGSTNIGPTIVQQARQGKDDASLMTQYVTEKELEMVERSFLAQRKLSFSFGFYFFLVTLLIPFLSISAEWWYAKPLVGGFTLNFWTTLFLFHVFYWVLAYFFVQKANKLDDQLQNLES